MLQHPWPGDRALFRHVSHQKRGNAALFGQINEPRSALAHLGHAAGRALQLGHVNGLDRVDDDSQRASGSQLVENGRETGLGHHVQAFAQRSQAPGAQADLRGRLLGGNVRDAKIRGC